MIRSLTGEAAAAIGRNPYSRSRMTGPRRSATHAGRVNPRRGNRSDPGVLHLRLRKREPVHCGEPAAVRTGAARRVPPVRNSTRVRGKPITGWSSLCSAGEGRSRAVGEPLEFKADPHRAPSRYRLGHRCVIALLSGTAPARSGAASIHSMKRWQFEASQSGVSAKRRRERPGTSRAHAPEKARGPKGVCSGCCERTRCAMMNVEVAGRMCPSRGGWRCAAMEAEEADTAATEGARGKASLPPQREEQRAMGTCGAAASTGKGQENGQM